MLQVDAVSASYGETDVLRDITCSIAPGEFVLLVGANGSGKTTLLDLLSGLETPDSGQILIDGADIVSDRSVARMNVARVFEDPQDQLLGATVETDIAFGPENLGFEPESIEERVTNALTAVQLTEKRDASITALSGGERARVALAGALAMDPSYLALDEPTSGIDHPGRQAIIDTFERVKAAGCGVLLATHDLRDLYPLVDRVIGLQSGRVALSATPAASIDQLPDLGVRVPTTWR